MFSTLLVLGISGYSIVFAIFIVIYNNMEASGAGRKRRREQLEAARRRKAEIAAAGRGSQEPAQARGQGPETDSVRNSSESEASADGDLPAGPSTATGKKFRLMSVGRESASASDSSGDDSDDEEAAETVIVRTAMMSSLVAGLLCLQCGLASLVVRAVDCKLGLVCKLETFCTSCGEVLRSTLSSNQLDGAASGVQPHHVTRQVVAASLDMGVGHAGINKLCRYLDMRSMHHTTFGKHAQAV